MIGVYVQKCCLLQNIKLKKIVCSFIVGSLIFILLVAVPDGTLYATDSIYARSFQREGERCSPRQHIMFLKTHKCGSSSIQNVLLRFGFKRNLTFALPSSGNYLGNPVLFENRMIPEDLLPSGELVDIFCVHSRLNVGEMRKVLHNDTFWVTTVRNPVNLFESLYNYFHMQDTYKVDLKDFDKVPLEVLQKVPRKAALGRNQISFDFGANSNLTILELSKKLEELDATFDIVMIMEKLEESLILLRHKLCWGLDDVVVFAKNARRKDLKESLSDSVLKRIKELNSADVIVYDHFLARHREAVYRFGEDRMRQEVEELRNLTKGYHNECVLKEVDGKNKNLEFKEYSNLVTSFLLKNDTDKECEYLALPELNFINNIRERQRRFMLRNRWNLKRKG